MNTLGWESLGAIRLRLEFKELEIRSSYAQIQALRNMHMCNGPLFERWDAEFRACMREREQLLPQLKELSATSFVGNHEFAELQKKYSRAATAKAQLEIELLKLFQLEEECLRASRAADRLDDLSRDAREKQSLRASIERACEAFDAQRVRSVELIEEFRRHYLDDAGSVVS